MAKTIIPKPQRAMRPPSDQQVRVEPHKALAVPQAPQAAPEANQGLSVDNLVSNLTGGVPQSFLDIAPDIFSNVLLSTVIEFLRSKPGTEPLVNALERGLALTQAQQQQLAEESARFETEARFQESRDIIDEGGREAIKRLFKNSAVFRAMTEADREAALKDLDGTKEEVIARLRTMNAADQEAFSAFSQPLVEGFRERESSIFSELEGLGEADRERINRDAFDERARQQAQLQARGFSSSNLLANIGTGVERERLEAQGFLDEQLRRERIGIFSDVGRETLDAEERLGLLGFDIGATGRAQVTGAENEFSFNAFDINRGFDAENRAFSTSTAAEVNQRAGQMDAELLRLLASRNDIPPEMMAFFNGMLGLGAADAPEVDQPSDAERWGGTVANAGVTLLTGNPMLGRAAQTGVDAGINQGGGAVTSTTQGLKRIADGQGEATSLGRKRLIHGGSQKILLGQ